jgi:hypothetical protein
LLSFSSALPIPAALVPWSLQCSIGSAVNHVEKSPTSHTLAAFFRLIQRRAFPTAPGSVACFDLRCEAHVRHIPNLHQLPSPLYSRATSHHNRVSKRYHDEITRQLCIHRPFHLASASRASSTGTGRCVRQVGCLARDPDACDCL